MMSAHPGDDIIYRFTFEKENEDPTTFFNIRLGKQNLKTTYKLEKYTRKDRQFGNDYTERYCSSAKYWSPFYQFTGWIKCNPITIQ